ncbi:ABA4-like family protein [Nonomuraea helvata]|uniref:ABA4-like family protein n=1 Tax=Nonomuraea helvata TaxID=37484 RepID=A0ABV5RZH2_9ACTN
MTSFLFDLSFYVAAPFWALMILAPTWRLTRQVAGSPLIVLPAVVVELVLLVPLFGEFWPVVTQPSLEGLQKLVTRPEALTALWAQILAWDLFLGRWMYLDSRERNIHPLVMAPMLILTILLSPIALPIYLVIRLPYRRNTGVVGAHG